MQHLSLQARAKIFAVSYLLFIKGILGEQNSLITPSTRKINKSLFTCSKVFAFFVLPYLLQY